MFDSRHPYTNACNFIRNAATTLESLVSALSRSQASLIRHAIADALGMPDNELACKLSAAFFAKHKVPA